MNHHSQTSATCVHGVILALLMLLLSNVGVILTERIDETCLLVQCPQSTFHCPLDSFLKSAIKEEDSIIVNRDEFDNNDDGGGEEEEEYNDSITSNPFSGVHIEALGPIQHSTTEEPHRSISQTAQSLRRKRQLIFTDFANEANSIEEILLERCCSGKECVCKTCPDVPKCGDNEVAIEVYAGYGLPGNCCSTYKCVQRVECNEKQHEQEYWRDACTKCSCFGGEELCHNRCQNDEPHKQPVGDNDQNCYSEYLGKPMLHGSSWFEDEWCSECSCLNGERSCLTNLCAAVECKNPIKMEGKCCPVCEMESPVHPIVVDVAGTTTTNEMQKNITITTTESVEGTSISSTQPPTSDTSTNILTNTTTEINDGLTSKSTTSEQFSTSNSSIDTSTTSDITSSTEGIMLNSTASSLSSQAIESTTTSANVGSSTETTISSTASTTDSSISDSTTATTTTYLSSSASVSSTLGSTAFNYGTTEDTSSSSSSSSSSASSSLSSSSTSPIAIETSTSSSTNGQTSSPISSSSSSSSSTTDAPLTSSSSASSSSSLSSSMTTDFISFYSSTTSSPSSLSSAITTEVFTTSAPASLEPQPTSYRQDSSNIINSQEHIRHVFDELYLVIIITLLAGSVMALGLIIRHARNKKKFYSTIPNSEASLSQTSTNTMLGV